MIWMLPALAAAPDDDGLRALLSTSMGADVPEKFLCVERVHLPEPFTPDLAAVGVKMKNTGCRLKGVVVGDGWVDPNDALAVAVGAGAWASLDSDGRKAAALRYTRDVLLAFDQPDAADTASVQIHGKAIAIEQSFWQRIPSPMTATHTDGAWTFDADGRVTKAVREGGTHVQTRFLLEDAGTKGISAEQVSESLALRGKPIKACYKAAWRADLSLRGKTRMTWDIADGKASNLKAKGEGSTALLKCYANGIGQVEFPPEAVGSVAWVFIILPVDVE